MPRAAILPCFVLVVLITAALLAPPVYWLVQGLAAQQGWLADLAEKPFPRFVSRAAMILAVFSLWPLFKLLRCSRAEIGLTRPDWTLLGRAMLLALISLGLFIALSMLLDGRDWRRSASTERIVRAVLLGSLAALIVGPLEEIVFRGVLYGLLRGPRRWLPALLASSVLFAAVHFLQSPRGETGAVQWHSGLGVLASMVLPADPEPTRPIQFLNLTLCGALLAWAYQRTGSLWFSIGLHSGWIFWLKFANSVTGSKPSEAWVWGSRKVIDGWGATIVLILTAALIPWLAKRRRADQMSNANPVPEQSSTLG